MGLQLHELRVLVIDDLAVVRQSIKAMLLSLGVTQIDFAPSIGEARKRIQVQRYDLVLCDYHLGGGANGQDFLEELRHSGIMPLTTAFFMVTAEAAYEKVVSVAEVAPDDYLLKPFSTRDLVERIARAVKKKLVLGPLYQAIDEQRFEQALSTGRQIMQEQPAYRLDASRLLAQLLNDLGRDDEALALYLEVVEAKAVPWARLGIASCHVRQGRKQEAAQIFESLLEQSPNYVAVYDKLARHYLDEGEPAKALAIMERAVQITPNSVLRLQAAGQLAFRLGQRDQAEALMKRAVICGGNSNQLDPRVLYQLLLSACGEGRTRDAEQYQAMLVDQVTRRETPLLKSLILLAHAAHAVLMGRHARADEIASLTVASLCEGQLDFDLALDLFGLLALLPADHAVAPQWIERICTRYAASRQNAEQLKVALTRRPDWSVLAAATSQRVLEIANTAMSHVANQEYASAARYLYDFALATRNPRLVRNAYSACVKAIAGGIKDLDQMAAVLRPMVEALEA
ncbi:response regulator [Chitinimonas lacunae]|uniref:Response regulator n=1 Tax=Chitinimonas lacunae TaxID=1963018 RepID=A0ABV8MSU3_9NEIS